MKKVIDFVTSKGILEQPDNCPIEIYEKVMKPCFIFEFSERPNFSELIVAIKKKYKD